MTGDRRQGTLTRPNSARLQALTGTPSLAYVQVAEAAASEGRLTVPGGRRGDRPTACALAAGGQAGGAVAGATPGAAPWALAAGGAAFPGGHGGTDGPAGSGALVLLRHAPA